MSDEEYVDAYCKNVVAIRQRLAESNEALARKIGELGPLNDEVQATFDSDGYLENLYIEPTAMTRYTCAELEDLVTEVLRAGDERLAQLVNDHYAQHLGPDSPLMELLRW
ncbi:hypothetical protein [Mycobacterium asiaticum]|uniref:Uncharacterized protein n=1 Tax=Mycobacterium asiaticum TaxID=1790 RepID=A0A1A3KHY5_MYCAS|nr:hypothetical protein [Mycobacterium asiaticum]OBJ84742.1 hypothetical protein A5640_15015 [Mycobacterium asiaticum]